MFGHAYELVEKIYSAIPVKTILQWQLWIMEENMAELSSMTASESSWTLFLLCLVKEKLRNWKSWIFVIQFRYSVADFRQRLV